MNDLHRCRLSTIVAAHRSATACLRLFIIAIEMDPA
jgi:hypothetical protein